MLPVIILFMPSSENILYVRNYIEFVIQKKIYIPEINEIEQLDGADYKTWCITKSIYHRYSIVYDPNDQIIKKNGTSTYDKSVKYRVFKVGEHFYMLSESFSY